MTPLIKVDRNFAVMDEKIKIKIQGLPPNAPVTVDAFIPYLKILHLGFGHFYANYDGVVKVWCDKSHGGTYTGKKEMGLFTSMIPLPCQFNGARFMLKGKANEILHFEVNIWKGHLTRDELHRLHIHYCVYGTYSSLPSKKNEGFIRSLFLTSTKIQRSYLDPSIERIQVKETVRETPIRGLLFLPPGDGPFPGVIDVFGGIGSCVEVRAALLAKQGYASLALAYFAYQDLPATDAWDYDMIYFDKAVEWLLSHPKVSKKGVGMVGVCQGSQNVLLAALRNPEVIAAVCINTNLFMVSDPSIDGNPINHMFEEDIGDPMGMVEIVNGMDVARIGGCPKLPRPRLTAKHDNPILFLMGEEDSFTHWPIFIKEIREQLTNSGKRNHWLEIVPGQGHLLEPPYSPMCNISKAGGASPKAKSNPKEHYYFLANIVFNYGGKRQFHEEGQELGWKLMSEFLKMHLMKKNAKL